MKKFSITQLENARRNPVDFAKQLNSTTAQPVTFTGYPKSMRWLNAINIFHEHNDISKSITYIEEAFRNRQQTSKNRKEVESFIEALGYYEDQLNLKKCSLIKSREPIDIPLSHLVRISGIIPIILMKPVTGFAAYFISQENTMWASELKFPIVQHYLANSVFNVDSSEIDVGYIDFFTGNFHEICFPQAEIDTAINELNDIGQKITLHL